MPPKPGTLGRISRFLLMLCIPIPLPLHATAETSDPGSATRAEMEVIEGAYAGPGVNCPLFTLSDGRKVTLSGTIPSFDSGAHFRLTGRWARISTCIQGATFHVFDAEEVKDTP